MLSPKVRFLLLRRQEVHPFSSCEAEYVYAELPAAVSSCGPYGSCFPASWRCSAHVGMPVQPSQQRRGALCSVMRGGPRTLQSATWCIPHTRPPLQHIGGGHLWLGVPSVIEHKIDHRSPLWGMGEAEIENAGEACAWTGAGPLGVAHSRVTTGPPLEVVPALPTARALGECCPPCV